MKRSINALRAASRPSRSPRFPSPPDPRGKRSRRSRTSPSTILRWSGSARISTSSGRTSRPPARGTDSTGRRSPRIRRPPRATRSCPIRRCSSQEALAWVGSNTFWAPDVIRLPDGRFYFYYCVGRLDAPVAALGVAVSDSITGPYTNVGRDPAVGDVRPAQPRRHELRPDATSQHRRSGRLLRPGREALDGVRLLFGRHLHPRARSAPPASRCRARGTGRS